MPSERILLRLRASFYFTVWLENSNHAKSI